MIGSDRRARLIPPGEEIKQKGAQGQSIFSSAFIHGISNRQCLSFEVDVGPFKLSRLVLAQAGKEQDEIIILWQRDCRDSEQPWPTQQVCDRG